MRGQTPSGNRDGAAPLTPQSIVLSPVPMPRFFPPAAAVVVICLAALATAAKAQGFADRGTADEAALREAVQSSEPFLDRKADSALGSFSRWRAEAKRKHLTAYLACYTGLLAIAAGVVTGLAAYRMSDPMAFYRKTRRRALGLGATIGAALGVFAAVMQVPPDASGKLSLLVTTIASGTLFAWSASAFAFLGLRLLSNRAARKDGRRMTDRMRHA